MNMFKAGMFLLLVTNFYALSEGIVTAGHHRQLKRTYYPDGLIKEEFEIFVNDSGDTIKDGKYFQYFRDCVSEYNASITALIIAGEMKCRVFCEGQYLNNYQNGIFICYSEFGEELSKINYQRGKKHGSCSSFSKNKGSIGNIITTGHYENDSKQGIWIEHDTARQITKKWTYRNDTLNGKYEEIKIVEKDTIITTGYFENNLQSGKLISKTTKGTITESINFVNGKINGTRVVKTPDGHVIFNCSYKDGQPHGEYNSWYPDGKPLQSGYFSNGVKNGCFKAWYNNGKLKYIENYLNGTPDSEWKTMDEDGSLLEESFFKNGVRWEYANYRDTLHN